MSENIKKFIEDYFTVIQKLDSIKILSVDLVPTNFKELVPTKIVPSFFEFLEKLEAKKLETESINTRYGAGYYDSIYKIFHDLTVITVVLVSKFKAGDANYIKIDEFYNFAVQLLISGSGRLALSFANVSSDAESLTELETNISNDYALITTSYKVPNREALFVMGNKNTPLFSSLLNKSSLDERDLGVEHPFIRSVIAPQIDQQSILVNTLGNLSPAISTQNVVNDLISDNLFHPNWFGLAVSNWLKPSIDSSAFSFLPSVDGSKTIVSKELKGLTWLQQVGFKDLIKLRSNIDTDNEEDSETNGEKEKKEEKEVTIEEKTPEPESNGTNKELRETKILDLKNLLTYNPAVDEEDVVSSILQEFPTTAKEVQSKINKLLIQLNKISKISTRDLELEKKLYFKIEKLLKYVILKNDITPSQLQLPISSKIPVTQNNYAGTLPGPLIGTLATPTFTANGANTRPGINGYKTNRLASINKKYRR